jgi:hypothetical protein
MQPWDAVTFDCGSVPTMVSVEEQHYLYWLGASLRGVGHVVEFGPWLGGTTICLAAGMRESKSEWRLHSYDNFVWVDYMSRCGHLPLASGESFEPAFLQNLRDYTDVVVAHREALPDDIIPTDPETMQETKRAIDIPQASWPSKEPIEILFVDGAKSWAAFRHVLAEFGPYLVPGKSLLVCQDYKCWGTYWLSIITELLGSSIGRVHDLLYNTIAFRVHRELPLHHVPSLEGMDRRVGEALIDSASVPLAPIDGSIVQTGKVSFLGHKGDLDGALRAYARIAREWPNRDFLHLQRCRAWLEQQLRIPIKPSVRERVVTALPNIPVVGRFW